MRPTWACWRRPRSTRTGASTFTWASRRSTSLLPAARARAHSPGAVQHPMPAGCRALCSRAAGRTPDASRQEHLAGSPVWRSRRGLARLLLARPHERLSCGGLTAEAHTERISPAAAHCACMLRMLMPRAPAVRRREPGARPERVPRGAHGGQGGRVRPRHGLCQNPVRCGRPALRHLQGAPGPPQSPLGGHLGQKRLLEHALTRHGRTKGTTWCRQSYLCRCAGVPEARAELRMRTPLARQKRDWRGAGSAMLGQCSFVTALAASVLERGSTPLMPTCDTSALHVRRCATWC